MSNLAATTTPADQAGVRTPRAGRRRLTIEQALRWAFATELVNAVGFGVGAEPSEQHPMWRMRVDGTAPGGWDAAAIARFVDPDALAIGAAVAALEGIELEPPEDLDPDERRLFFAWRGRATTLVVTSAKLGRPPPAGDEIPSAEPIFATNGRVVVRRMVSRTERVITGERLAFDAEEIVAVTARARVKGSSGHYPSGSFCPLQWFPSFESVAIERIEARIWREALAWLASRLKGLERIEIVDPADSPAPIAR